MKTKLLPLLALCALLVPTLAIAQAATADAAAAHAASRTLLQENKVKEAVAELDRAIALDANNPNYHADLGAAISRLMPDLNFMQRAMSAGKMKKAFERAVELNPQHLGGLIGLTRYYSSAPEIAGGSMEKAKATAERVRLVNPFLGELELGNVAERTEDFTTALAHFDAAAQLNPTHAGALTAAGRVLVRLERMDEARARFAAALTAKPDHAPARDALAALDQPPAQN